MTQDPRSPDRRALLAAGALLAAPAAASAQAPEAAFQPPMAGTFPVQPPATRLAWEAEVTIAPVIDMGDSPLGKRRMIPITGGTFVGPRLRGKVLPGGADRQLVRKDGVTLLNALYEMQTDDGAVLTILNRVTIDANAKPPSLPRSMVEVTAPEGPHGWLNRRIFVGDLHPLPPERKAVLIRVYEVV
ncbi:MAG: DUF3237 domain-containing protein [Caulobacteraceae bacterium]